MTVINISDIVKDIEDIEDYADETVKKKLIDDIQYYPSRLCNDLMKRFLELRDRKYRTLDYLMMGNLPLRDKFFSARNENILYLYTEYQTVYRLKFYVLHDEILKFVNDTDKEFYVNQKIVVKYKCDGQSGGYNAHKIVLLDKRIDEGYKIGSTDTVKLNISELALVNY